MGDYEGCKDYGRVWNIPYNYSHGGGVNLETAADCAHAGVDADRVRARQIFIELFWRQNALYFYIHRRSCHLQKDSSKVPNVTMDSPRWTISVAWEHRLTPRILVALVGQDHSQSG